MGYKTGDSCVPVKEQLPYPIKYPGEEFNSTFPVKYPHLYSPPKYPELQPHPSKYEQDYLLMFPVDTPNFIPATATNFKQQQELPPALSMPNHGTDANCLLPDDQNFDLNSLLMLPTPANKELTHFNGDLTWDFLGGLKQPNLEDIDVMNYLEANLPDEMHSWHGLEKGASYHGAAPQAPKESTESFVSMPIVEQQTHTPMDQGEIMFFNNSHPADYPTHLDQPAEANPMEMTSPTSENMHTPSSASDNWGQNPETLYEEKFDISDVNITAQDKVVANLDHTPPHDASQQTPPHVLSSNSPSHERPTNRPKDAELKSKPTPLLFGKHDSAIIHKLLAVKQGARRKPLTRDKLIVMPVEEFNSLLEQARLSEIEVAFMKEWRRRGKNKAAAQIARKRKREEVSDLDLEVYNMHEQKIKLEKRCKELQLLVESLKARSKAAEEKLFAAKSSVVGQPVSNNTHHMIITEDEELLLIPRANSKLVVAN